MSYDIYTKSGEIMRGDLITADLVNELLRRIEFLEESIMDRLHVTAISEDALAAPGNQEPNYIVVSVTDNKGEPVTGLTTATFEVSAFIAPPGGASVDIKQINTFPMPGFYSLSVVPVQNLEWKQGVYIFGIAVTKGDKKGQTLAKVEMD